MKTYWVLGHPLSFCLTTEVMNAAFEELKIDARFETKDVPPEELAEVLQRLKLGELDGLLLTRPHKTPSLMALDQKSDSVSAIQAVNLILNQDGRLMGHNLDSRGSIDALQTVMPDLQGRLILILGAGGAARAAAYACKNQGAQVALWNRTPEKAEAAAKSLGVEWVPDLRHWASHPEVIINATALSSEPKQSTLVPYPLWQRVEVAMDAVYGKTSLFLEEAEATQVRHILSGQIWFLKQTIHVFERITGQKAPLELITRLTDEAKDIVIEDGV